MRLVPAIRLLLGLSLFTSALPPASAGPMRCRFWQMSHFDRAACPVNSETGRTVLTTPVITPAAPWEELVASWNADVPPSAALEVFARGVIASHRTRWYSLGYWAASGHKPARTSRPGQHDADGQVKTDTLVLTRPAKSFQVRVVMDKPASLRFLGVSLTSPQVAAAAAPPDRAAWGRALAVPGFSQLSYPQGEGWCSPASVAMVLSYWAKQCHDPQWNRSVPQCADGIYDRARAGTGNWPFNTAYAGSLPGLRAYVTRLENVRSLEDWIVQGVPVILAVSVSLKSGADLPGTSGHLIVCTGFTPNGDLIVNDPWTHQERGESVRRVIPRRRLGTLWARSEHTAYIIHPIRRHPAQESIFP